MSNKISWKCGAIPQFCGETTTKFPFAIFIFTMPSELPIHKVLLFRMDMMSALAKG